MGQRRRSGGPGMTPHAPAAQGLLPDHGIPDVCVGVHDCQTGEVPHKRTNA